MPRKSNWNSPTTAIRVPEHTAPTLLAIAQLLDRGPSLHWDESVDMRSQVIWRLSQFHTYVEVVVREIKRTKQPPTAEQYERLVNALMDAVDRYKEANYRLFCERIGQPPNPKLGRSPICPLLTGLKVGDRCQAHGIVGQLVIHDAPGEGDRYVAFQPADGPRQVFNQRLAADLEHLEVA